MLIVNASFNKISNVEIEVTIKATYQEWKDMLELINADKYPGYQLYQAIRDTVRKLEDQITTRAEV
jgi:hypothetical protein